MRKTVILKPEWLLFSEYATLSRENKFNLSGVFDVVRLSGIPATLPRFFISGIFKGSPETKYKTSLKIIPPKKKKEITTMGPSIKTGKNGKVNLLIDIVNMRFEEFGVYKIKLFSEDRLIASKSLPAEKLPKKDITYGRKQF